MMTGGNCESGTLVSSSKTKLRRRCGLEQLYQYPRAMIAMIFTSTPLISKKEICPCSPRAHDFDGACSIIEVAPEGIELWRVYR